MFEPGLTGIDASSLLRVRLLAGAALLALLYVGFRARSDVAERMGFTDADVALLTVGGLAAPVLSVPVAVVDEAVFAVNLGGALVPLILALRLYHRGHLPLGRTVLGAVPVGVVTWWIVDVEPGVGVIATFPGFLLPALVALAVGLAAGGVRPDRAGPIALGAGSLGALVGADLVTLPQVLEVARAAPPGTALVLGGGGSFDLVFLAGAIGLALSLALTLITTTAGPRPLGWRGGGPVRVPRPRRLLSELDSLPGWTPRERALASLARANLALEVDRNERAVQEAREAIGSLLASGSPTLAEEARSGRSTPQLADLLDQLDTLQATPTRGEDPDHAGPPPGDEDGWYRAASAVEEAKHITGLLWPHAPGRVRVQGWRR